MKISRLLLGSRNAGKIGYLTEALADLPLAITSLTDIAISDDVKETGTTFEENSELKARYYFKKSGIPTLADDSGLMIDILHGEPGVLSRRWPGYEANDQEIVDFMLMKLKGIPPRKRTASFVSAITVFISPEIILRARGETRGYLLDKPRTPLKAGIPWSSYFYIPAVDKVHGALNLEESKRYSHRGAAMQKIKKQLQAYV